MSLILRKSNFAADWRAVGRRCVVNPECCEEVTQIPLPCGTGCDYTLPSTMYVTFAGQTRIPDGSYAVRKIDPAAADAFAFGSFPGPLGADVTLPTYPMVWAAGSISLETLSLLRGDAYGSPSGIGGPKHCLPITPNAFGFPRYLALYVWPHCQPGGGLFLQVGGMVIAMVPTTILGIAFDGLIEGYCLQSFPDPMTNAMTVTTVRGIGCSDLLPWLDQSIVCGGTLDVTQ